MGTWDDHDFGPNNEGVAFPLRKEIPEKYLPAIFQIQVQVIAEKGIYQIDLLRCGFISVGQ
ncbi:MAG: hypothetical protein IPO62_00035 [Saprospiraceae bacterium]|nr:hypothetical protein [Saprospiraceae bacterium]